MSKAFKENKVVSRLFDSYVGVEDKENGLTMDIISDEFENNSNSDFDDDFRGIYFEDEDEDEDEFLENNRRCIILKSKYGLGFTDFFQSTTKPGGDSYGHEPFVVKEIIAEEDEDFLKLELENIKSEYIDFSEYPIKNIKKMVFNDCNILKINFKSIRFIEILEISDGMNEKELSSFLDNFDHFNIKKLRIIRCPINEEIWHKIKNIETLIFLYCKIKIEAVKVEFLGIKEKIQDVNNSFLKDYFPKFEDSLTMF